MRTLTNVLLFLYAMLFAFFYKFLSYKFGLPAGVAGQWYVLSAIVVYVTSVCGIGFSLMNLVHHFDGDGDTSQEYKVQLYNYLGGKKISIWWQVIAYIMAGIMFQYSEYIASVSVMLIAVTMHIFRMMHNKTVLNEEVAVLKDGLRK